MEKEGMFAVASADMLEIIDETVGGVTPITFDVGSFEWFTVGKDGRNYRMVTDDEPYSLSLIDRLAEKSGPPLMLIDDVDNATYLLSVA